MIVEQAVIIALTAMGCCAALVVLCMSFDNLLKAAEAKRMAVEILSFNQIAERLADIVELYDNTELKSSELADMINNKMVAVMIELTNHLPKPQRQIVQQTIYKQKEQGYYNYVWDLAHKALKKRTQNELKKNVLADNGHVNG